MTRPIPIDAAFEREAREATHRCWVCRKALASSVQAQAHREKQHPDWGRLHIRWEPKTRAWVGGFGA